MILAELKAYLIEHRRVELADLASRFDVAPEALRGMLERLIDKGRVRRIADAGPCDGCCGCATATPEIYAWRHD